MRLINFGAKNIDEAEAFSTLRMIVIAHRINIVLFQAVAQLADSGRDLIKHNFLLSPVYKVNCTGFENEQDWGCINIM